METLLEKEEEKIKCFLSMLCRCDSILTPIVSYVASMGCKLKQNNMNMMNQYHHEIDFDC